jgi:hypothetical protein
MNGDLYVGGAFSQAGGLESLKIAKWSGSSWSPVGFRGIGDVNSIETVDSLAVSGGMLYAGGNFKSAGQVSNQASNIARWDGTSWSSMGSGVDGRVYALTASGSAVYAGGSFTSAGGNPADGIAKWNGTTWSPLGLGIGGIVWSIVTTGNDVYVGGEFYDAGYQEASRVAKWNGSAWSPVGSGMDGTVHSLALYGGKLYAGGQFEKADGKVAYNIAMWNGNTWSPLGSGLDGGVSNMVISPTGDLYACGNFVAARNSTVSPYLIRGLIRNDAPVISAPAKSEPPIMLLP